MPRKCTICSHPDCEAIDKALVNNESFRTISHRFNLSIDSLKRHKANHIAVTLSMAHEADQVAHADDLLGQIRDLQQRTMTILSSNTGKDDRIALTAIAQARQNIDLLGRLLGELQQQPTVNVLVTSPDWLRLRSVILRTLDSYPEIKLIMAQSLAEVESVR